MIGIVDYNAGNIRSVEHALFSLGEEYVISDKPRDLEKADRVIFPGVGDAQYAMKQLEITGYDSFLRDFASSGKPLLGICLGSQIIFEHSEEGDTACLGLIPGTIRHFAPLLGTNTDHFKIPHMGWNDISYTSKKPDGSSACALFDGISEGTCFYFVHSYLIQPADSSVITAAAQYGVSVPAAVQYKNISAMQFHPEKSGESGLKILKNFARKDFVC